MTTAVYVGAALVALGAAAAFAIGRPARRRPHELEVAAPEPAFGAEAA